MNSDIFVTVLMEAAKIGFVLDEVKTAVAYENVDALVVFPGLLLGETCHIGFVKIREIRCDLNRNMGAVSFAQHDSVIGIADQDTPKFSNDALKLVFLSMFPQIGPPPELFQAVDSLTDTAGEGMLLLSANGIEVMAPNAPDDSPNGFRMQCTKLLWGKVQRMKKNRAILCVMLIEVFHGKTAWVCDAVWDPCCLRMILLEDKQMHLRIKVEIELMDEVCVDRGMHGH